jgi:cytochrome c553
MSQHACLPRVAALTCAVVIFGACTEPKQQDDLHGHMGDHFSRAAEVRRSIIDGDVEGARDPARWLADHEQHQNLPREWAAHLTAMQQAARGVAEAKAISDAAHATAMIGQACGWCHETLGVARETVGVEPPGDRHETAAHMLRHQWAAERMWDGLVLPSRDAWIQGIEILMEPALFDGDRAEEELKSLAQTVHSIGEKGRDALGTQERAVIYAEFLATCAECHRRIGMSSPRP